MFDKYKENRANSVIEKVVNTFQYDKNSVDIVTYNVKQTKYDVNTGEPFEEITSVTLESIVDKIAELQAKLDSYSELLIDIEAVK